MGRAVSGRMPICLSLASMLGSLCHARPPRARMVRTCDYLDGRPSSR